MKLLKSLKTLPFIVSLSLLSLNTYSAPIPGLYNTGVDDNGNALPYGEIDTHYSVSGQASTAFSIQRNPAWVHPPSDSTWIGPINGTSLSSPGEYIYQTQFDLSGFDPSTAIISGGWAYDNIGKIFLNGIDAQVSSRNFFHSISNFTIDEGFVAGVNTLEFRVTNTTSRPNPTGLLVSDLRGEASEVSAPSTVSFFLSLSTLIILRRPLFRKALS